MSIQGPALLPRSYDVKIAQEFPGNIPTYQAAGPYKNEQIAFDVVVGLLKKGPSEAVVAVFKDSQGQFYVTPLKVDDPRDGLSAEAALRKMHGSDIVPFSLHGRKGNEIFTHVFPSAPRTAPRQ